MAACIEDGLQRPTAQQVADRAGVSVRGVFRHFRDLGELFSAAARLQHQLIHDSLSEIPVNVAFETRVTAFSAQQGRINERIWPIRRAATNFAPDSEPLVGWYTELREWKEGEIRRLFRRELKGFRTGTRQTRMNALVAVTSWNHWEELREHASLPVAEARRVVELQVSSLLENA